MTAEAPGLASRPGIAGVLRKHWPRVAQFGAALVIVFAFQHLMLRLSGGALWLPSEWRNAIQILGMGVAALVFEMARPVKPGAPSGEHADASEPPAPPATPVHHERPWQFTAAFLAIAIIGLIGYILLRNKTMVSWNLDDWKRDVGWHEDEHDGPGVTRDGSLPPTIIDTRRNEIFLPVYLPKPIAERIKDRAALGRESSGLQDYLQHDPHELIDLLSIHAGNAYWVTITLFLLAHVLVLVGAAGAAGSRISVQGAAIESIVARRHA